MELEVGSACDKRGQGAKDPLLLWSRKNGRTEEPVLSIFPPPLLLLQLLPPLPLLRRLRDDPALLLLVVVLPLLPPVAVLEDNSILRTLCEVTSPRGG